MRCDGFELDGVRQRVSPSHVILIDEEADGATSLAALMKIENLLKLEPHISEALAAHPAVRELIEGEVARVNGELASFESIKGFGYCPASSRSKGELPPSLKVKRKVIAERYRRQIEEMYA